MLTTFDGQLEDAIRSGLRDAGVRGVLADTVAHIRDHVLIALRQNEPSAEEVMDLIKSNGGFMHLGDDIGFPDGRRASHRTLNNALMRLWREAQEEEAA